MAWHPFELVGLLSQGNPVLAGLSRLLQKARPLWPSCSEQDSCCGIHIEAGMIMIRGPCCWPGASSWELGWGGGGGAATMARSPWRQAVISWGPGGLVMTWFLGAGVEGRGLPSVALLGFGNEERCPQDSWQGRGLGGRDDWTSWAGARFHAVGRPCYMCSSLGVDTALAGNVF